MKVGRVLKEGVFLCLGESRKGRNVSQVFWHKDAWVSFQVSSWCRVDLRKAAARRTSLDAMFVLVYFFGLQGLLVVVSLFCSVCVSTMFHVESKSTTRSLLSRAHTELVRSFHPGMQSEKLRFQFR